MPKEVQDLVLPIINLTFPDMDYGQQHMLDILQLYSQIKQQKDPENTTDFTFDVQIGLCTGLVAYWLYCKRVGEEGKFIDKLEYALRWDAEAFANRWAKEDPKLEVFANVLMFLSYDLKLRTAEVTQADLNVSMQLLLSEFYPKIEEAEFKINFSFTKTSLAELIKEVVHPNKMVRFSDGFHTTGLMYSGGVYYFYNPDSKSGPKAYYPSEELGLDELAADIFASHTISNTEAEHLALHIGCFDIEDAAPGQYRHRLEISKSLLADKEYIPSCI